MGYFKRRIMAAMTGVAAACGVFGVAFAASPSIMMEEDRPTDVVYQAVQALSKEEMQTLQEEYMDQETLSYIKDTLVEDTDISIMMAYLQIHPEFSEVIMEFEE